LAPKGLRHSEGGVGGVSEFRIVAAGAERLTDVEPLWRSLLEHHLKVDDPDLAAIRRERQTWAGRRQGFEQLLAHPHSFMLIAETGGTPVGYCVVDVRDRAGNWRITGDRYADLESIAVLPVARGHGVGTALMYEVYRALRALGIDELTTQVVIGNHEARRFYERMGFRHSTVNYLGRVPD
jgi:ribosomal protein S18 acetylase RimI-like enzyme